MLSLPSVKTYEVTMTCEAPASMYFRALEGLMPPPTCRGHGNSKKSVPDYIYYVKSLYAVILRMVFLHVLKSQCPIGFTI